MAKCKEFQKLRYNKAISPILIEVPHEERARVEVRVIQDVKRLSTADFRGQYDIYGRSEPRFYRAVQPPSITRLVPVMRDPARDARNTIAPATSSIRPIRPRGIRLNTQFRNSASAKNEAVMGVSRKVGAIALTRMLFGASSTAIALVSPSIACFVRQ